jgi:hypothetical protein
MFKAGVGLSLWMQLGSLGLSANGSGGYAAGMLNRGTFVSASSFYYSFG